MQFKNWLIEASFRDLANLYKSKLAGVPQDPVHHKEGNVLIHSRMVRKSIKQAHTILSSYTGDLGNVLSLINFNLSPEELELLALATWSHDIGKVTATGVDDNGKIHARGHQDKNHFMPQLQDLEKVSTEKTKQLYYQNKDLVDWLIEHHMDFVSGSFGKSFIADNFDNGRVKPTQRMKLLLILMWADQLGRGTVSLSGNEKALLTSAKTSLIRSNNIAKQSKPFSGDAASFVQLLRQRGLDNSVIKQSLKNKFPELQDQDIDLLLNT